MRDLKNTRELLKKVTVQIKCLEDLYDTFELPKEVNNNKKTLVELREKRSSLKREIKSLGGKI